MKRAILFLFLLFSAMAFGQAGASTPIRYGTALPNPGRMSSLFSLTTGVQGLYYCAARTCTVASDWLYLGNPGPLQVTGKKWTSTTTAVPGSFDFVLGLGSDNILKCLLVDGTSCLPAGSGSSGSVTWGNIGGTLSSQTDLQAALNGKVGTGTTVNGHALTGNITVALSDLGGTLAHNQLPTLLAGDIPALAESQVTNLASDLAGKAATSHTHTEAQVTNLVSDLAAKASDTAVVHNAGNETVAGIKTFSSPITGSVTGTAAGLSVNIAESQVTNLVSDLTAKAPTNSPAFTGTPTAPTVALNDNSLSIATTAWVRGQGYGGGGSSTWGSITGTLSSQTDLQNALNLKATDTSVVHNSGNESIAGTKTFSSTIGGNISGTSAGLSSNIAESQVTNLVSDLAAKASSASLATVATSGSYTDLSNKPTIPAPQINSDWNAGSGLAQILNKPTIPSPQVQTDWNASAGIGVLLNKPALATVATSGSYSDLSNKPAIVTLPIAESNVTNLVSDLAAKQATIVGVTGKVFGGTTPSMVTVTSAYVDSSICSSAGCSQNTSGTAAGLSANIAESQVTNLVTDLAAARGISNLTPGQVPVAGSSTTLTSSIPISGNGGTLVSTTGLGSAPGVQPCTDGSGNLTTTCTTAAVGLGVYLFAGGKQDSGCMQMFASEDGKQVRPMNWPLDPALGGTYCGGGSPGTATASAMFSSLFRAPWNNTYYLFYDDYVHTSGYTMLPAIGVSSSQDLVTWTFITDLPSVNGHGASANSYFFDAVAQCPAQDYTCLHVIAPSATDGATEVPYEWHPTNSSLSAWSSGTQLASGVVQAGVNNWSVFLMNYNGTYYLFWDEFHGAPSANSYYIYSSSTLTGTYTFVADTKNLGWCPLPEATCSGSQGGTEGLTMVWTGSAWRAYLHPAQNLLGGYYVENTTSPVAATGWSSPVTVDGLIDGGVQQWTVFRTSDPKTISIVAATARQSTLPLAVRRGVGNCDNSTTTFNTPGIGGVYGGTCYGVEQVNSAQQGSYQALRLYASNSISGYSAGQHIDFGHYTNTTSFVEWLKLQPKSAWFAGSITPAPTTFSGLAALNPVDGSLASITDGQNAGDPCGAGSGSIKATCRYDGSVWHAVHTGVHNWSVNATWTGIVPASSYLTIYQVPTYSPAITITIPANCAGSTLKAYTNTTNNSTFTVAKNGSTICTATVGAGGTTVSWSTGGSAFTLTSGDIFTIQGGGDATLANLGMTVLGSY